MRTVTADAQSNQDDAKEAHWVKLTGLAALEYQLFEDHAAILDHFLGTFSARAWSTGPIAQADQ
jgi:hypothetical protein